MNEIKEKAVKEMFDVARKMGSAAKKVQGYVAEIKQLLFEYTKSIEEIGNIPERTCDNCGYQRNGCEQFGYCDMNRYDPNRNGMHKFAHEIEERTCENCHYGEGRIYCDVGACKNRSHHKFKHEIEEERYCYDDGNHRYHKVKHGIGNRNCFDCRVYENCFNEVFRKSGRAEGVLIDTGVCSQWEKKND